MENRGEIQRKRGKFRIGKEFLDPDYYEFIQKIMGLMIVVRAEFLWEHNAIEYVAMSEEFRELEMGEKAPFYFITITKGETETVVSFKEIKDDGRCTIAINVADIYHME